MRLYRFLLIPSIAIAQLASALDITSTPGNLSTLIGEQTDATILNVTGEINAADFAFIADKMTSLVSLDISKATVTAYDGKPLTLAATKFSAAELPPYALAGCKATTVILPAGITAIGEGALSSSAITSIVIPSSVKAIGMGAFSNCDGLTSATIPATVNAIGTHAFMDCDNLASVDYSSSLSDLPASIFDGCEKLSTIKFTTQLTSIGDNAFKGCANLSSLTLSNSINSIGASAFRSSGITAIDLTGNKNISTIGAWAFAQCPSLTSVSLPDQVISIGEGAFFECAKLTNANIPVGVTEIANYTFNGATAVNTEKISHDDITLIGNYALRGISASTFTIPGALEHMGDYAMEGWGNLSSMKAETSIVPALGEGVWTGVNQANVTVTVNDDLLTEFKSTPQWQEFVITGTTGITEIVNDDAKQAINAYFVNTDLIIKATQPIASVRLYDSAGRQWAHTQPHAEQTTIDTSAWNCHIYIVAITLSDGTAASIKIARR